MGFYKNLSFRIFSQFTESIAGYFDEVKVNLKKANLKSSLQEYLSVAIFTSFIAFLVHLPVLSFAFSILLQSFLFGFVFAITVSFAIAVAVFLIFQFYPKMVTDSKAKTIDNSLPFASLYLSTVAGSKLPLHKVLQIFSKFSGYRELSRQINAINEDMQVFGLDVNTSLERAVERTPSNKFKELIYGMLSVLRTGGDMAGYLKDKSVSFMNDYRRRLTEYARNLTIFTEIYLTAVVMGAIFFTILTSIIVGINVAGSASAAADIIVLQFFITFFFLPLISAMFIVLIKTSAPGGE